MVDGLKGREVVCAGVECWGAKQGVIKQVVAAERRLVVGDCKGHVGDQGTEGLGGWTRAWQWRTLQVGPVSGLGNLKVAQHWKGRGKEKKE